MGEGCTRTGCRVRGRPAQTQRSTRRERSAGGSSQACSTSRTGRCARATRRSWRGTEPSSSRSRVGAATRCVRWRRFFALSVCPSYFFLLSVPKMLGSLSANTTWFGGGHTACTHAHRCAGDAEVVVAISQAHRERWPGVCTSVAVYYQNTAMHVDRRQMVAPPGSSSAAERALPSCRNKFPDTETPTTAAYYVKCVFSAAICAADVQQSWSCVVQKLVLTPTVALPFFVGGTQQEQQQQ